MHTTIPQLLLLTPNGDKNGVPPIDCGFFSQQMEIDKSGVPPVVNCRWSAKIRILRWVVKIKLMCAYIYVRIIMRPGEDECHKKHNYQFDIFQEVQINASIFHNLKLTRPNLNFSLVIYAISGDTSLFKSIFSRVPDQPTPLNLRCESKDNELMILDIPYVLSILIKRSFNPNFWGTTYPALYFCYFYWGSKN